MKKSRFTPDDIFIHAKHYAIKLRRFENGKWVYDWAVSLWVNNWEDCTSKNHSDIHKLMRAGWVPVEYVLLDPTEEVE